MNILVVDDSVVYRSQIRAALNSAAFIKEIDVANNGKIAIDKLASKNYDLVTLDLEMPELDGIETLKEIKKRGFSSRIIMFSSQTKAGSEKTLEALSLGADDFLAKPSGENLNMNNAADTIKELLLPKVRQFIVGSPSNVAPRESAVSNDVIFQKPKDPTFAKVREKQNYTAKDLNVFQPKLVVIASSTGGPPCLEKVFKGLGSQVSCPILIAQHMPPVFTASLASRIKEVSGTEAAEAKNMEVLANKIYVAPGDYHMSIANFAGGLKVQLDQRPERNHVRPAADYLFESAANQFGASVLGIVLTGMGDDGCDGAMAIKSKSGGVIIQTRETCSVFGMPGAVNEVKAFDSAMDPESINMYLKRKLAL